MRRVVMTGLIVAIYAARIELTAAAPPKRARPPKFPDSVKEAFFTDARKQLVGPRPETKSAAPKSDAQQPGGIVGSHGELASRRAWSELISAEALEDEIKAQQIALGASLQNPTKFKAGEYQKAHMHFSMLAALFAIDSQYGQSVRWWREAASVCDLMGRGAAICKIGTDAAYKEAKSRADDLETLVRGGSIAPRESTSKLDWPKIAERGPLMKRLEVAHEQGLLPGVAAAASFANSADKLSHEAQLIAALADVIMREGYEFSDDETYGEYAQAMQTGALEVRAGVEQKDFQRARNGVESIGRACRNCHEGFRN